MGAYRQETAESLYNLAELAKVTYHRMVDSISMPTAFHFRAGEVPLLMSFPHEGSLIPDAIAQTMTEHGRSSWDTDWFLDRLYDFPELDKASRIAATMSRYVIDLNRAADDVSLYPGQNTTGLLPLITFDQQPLYEDGNEPDEAERQRRIREIWRPYHDCLESELLRLRDKFGRVVLFEAHSIASQVPFLFDGKLPDLNLGTNHGATCDPSMRDAVRAAVESTDGYSHVFDGRFVGGYITRHYGKPSEGIHTIQLELSQATHLNEATKEWDADKVAEVRPVLRAIIQALLGWVGASSDS